MHVIGMCLAQVALLPSSLLFPFLQSSSPPQRQVKESVHGLHGLHGLHHVHHVHHLHDLHGREEYQMLIDQQTKKKNQSVGSSFYAIKAVEAAWVRWGTFPSDGM